MLVLRNVSVAVAALGLIGASPASAQFFFKPADLSGAPVTGAEPGMIGPELPGATPAELRAALVWNLRAALNVAALQCDFAPTLLTRVNYNAMLRDHKDELNTSVETLTQYFVRNARTRKQGITDFDRYNTRVYSGFSTISAQLTFCQAAGSVSHQVIFTRPGHLGDVAVARMRELRASLVPYGEQQFRRNQAYVPFKPVFPPFGDPKCWKRDVYNERKCGPLS